jgi:hypothetical protein
LECSHEFAEIRLRVFADGTKHFHEQCLECGRSLRTFKRSQLFDMGLDLAKVARFDPTLEEQYRKRQMGEWKRTHETEQRKRQEEWWTHYRAYMESPEWYAIRYLVLERCRYICEGCGKASAVHVHHRHYQNFGSEMLFDLAGVCLACHEKIHQRILTMSFYLAPAVGE